VWPAATGLALRGACFDGRPMRPPGKCPRLSPGELAAPTAGHSFGHRAKRGVCVVVTESPESGERRRCERGLLDRRLLLFLEEPQQPACADARSAARVLLRDQDGEGERLVERDPPDLSGGNLGDQQVATLAGSLQGRPRMTGRDRDAFPGSGGTSRLARVGPRNSGGRPCLGAKQVVGVRRDRRLGVH
jgi:hypothetical protein